MDRTARTNVIDMTAYFTQVRRSRRQDRLHTVLALWTQYLSIAALALYAVLRLVFCAGVPLGAYSGPLAILWPVSFLLLATSYFSDILLWQGE